ncbi:hypothetical protein [Burkholderia contaminans]|uniref:hypothetical protein n=1 Tax=Burkholderia contaminans TaxID=488447 RepID=UPI000F598BF9|nr:hypothetical protein [Burkholderia contaminans]
MKIIKALDTAPPVNGDDELSGTESQYDPLGDEVVVIKKPVAGHPQGRIYKVHSERPTPVAESVRYFPEGRILAIYLRGRQLPVNIHVDDVIELTDLNDRVLSHVKVAFAGKVLTIEDQDIDISVEGLLKNIGGSGGGGHGGHSLLGKGSFRFR